MSLILMDGFDNYSVITDKWSGVIFQNPSFQSGGINGRFIRFGTNFGSLYKGVPARATYIVGVRLRKPTSFDRTTPIVEFLYSGTRQIEVHVGTDRKVRIKRNGTTLATSATEINPDTWYYFEVKATIADSGGSVEVRVGGSVIVSYTGDTQNHASALIDEVRLPGNPTEGNYSADYDDVYICDDQGGVNDDFLGDVKVETIYPTGAGAHTDFTPSAGSNWQNVDDAQSDDDSTYNSSSNPGDIDTFQLGDLATLSGTVKAIQVCNDWRKDDAGSRTMRRVIRTGATDFEGGDVGLADSYVMNREVIEQNPDTGVDWTIADVNALEAGYKIQA